MANQDSSEDDALDLSNQGLKKLAKPSSSHSKVTKLILDNNDLTRLDFVDCYGSLKTLSAAHNGLLRMYNIARLHQLVSLNLSHNAILTIEALKEATQLRWLGLAGNNIKTIEHLNTNTLLEHIDLSDNNISFITDISFLTNLKTLLLSGNKIGHLQACDKFLPQSLDTLSLSANNITDLNQVSFLVNLRDLRQLSIANNPCVAMTGNNIGFDYRPFLINWCMSLKVIDGFMVNEIESLKAEWLYSQGRGRQFRPGDHESLVAYLASTCPLGGESLETEEDRKLRLILSKAQQHRQQLKDQQADGTLQRSSSVSPFTRRRTSNSFGRGSLNKGRRRTYTPDRMTTSCYSELPSSGGETPPLMTQSLDLSALNFSDNDEPRRKVPTQLVPQDEDSPLHSATEMVPVPDSLLSPEYRQLDILPNSTPAQTPATPATPATPSHPLAKKGIAQPLATNLPRPNSASRHSRLPVRGGSTGVGLATHSPVPVAGGCLDDSSTSRRTDAVSLGTPYEQPEKSFNEMPSFIPEKSLRKDGDHPILDSKKSPLPASKRNGIEGTNDSASHPKLAAKTTQNTETGSASAPEQPKEPRRPTSLDLSFQNGCSAFKAEFYDAESRNCAATSIQRLWRGYQTRNLNPQVGKVNRSIQDKRMLDHIRKLTEDLETTKSALESERRLQLLQMQAISALWKKVVSLQSGSNPINVNSQPGSGPVSITAADLITSEPVGSSNAAESIRKLTHSCLHLHTQVAELQQSMQEVMGTLGIANRQGTIPRVASSTQTELSAVHTPVNASSFPFQPVNHPENHSDETARCSSRDLNCVPAERVASRPSSLALNAPHATPRQTPPQLNHFANSLVDGVLRTVSSSDQTSWSNTPDENSSRSETTVAGEW